MATRSFSSALCGVSTRMCTPGRDTNKFYFRRQREQFHSPATSLGFAAIGFLSDCHAEWGERGSLQDALGGGSSLGPKKSERLPVIVGH